MFINPAYDSPRSKSTYGTPVPLTAYSGQVNEVHLDLANSLSVLAVAYFDDCRRGKSPADRLSGAARC